MRLSVTRAFLEPTPPAFQDSLTPRVNHDVTSANRAARSRCGFYYLKARRERGRVERLAAAALESLLNAIDANDPATGAHVRRVAAVSLIIADACGLSERERSSVERVALFHDVGKVHEALFDITHDDHILSAEERQEIATHPQLGADVVAPLSLFYPDLGAGVLAHHERWDGTGYPRGLRGTEIPLAARIVAVADTFDAITHHRRYDMARSTPDAVEVIAAERGRQFDPEHHGRVSLAGRADIGARRDAATAPPGRHPRG